MTATANPDGLGRGAPEARLRVGLDGLLVADRVERRDDRPHEGNLTVDLGMVAIFKTGKRVSSIAEAMRSITMPNTPRL